MGKLIKILCLAILLPFVAKAEEVGAIVYEFEITEQGATITGVHDENNESITELVIPMTLTKDGAEHKVTAIAAEAFKDMTDLKSVSICVNVVEVGARAFANCANLKYVDLGDGVCDMGEAVFDGCKLEFIEFKGDEIGLIIGFDQALNGCDLSDAMVLIPTKYAVRFLANYPEHFSSFSGISFNVWGYSKAPIFVAYAPEDFISDFFEITPGNSKTILAHKDRKLNVGWLNPDMTIAPYIYPNFNGVDVEENAFKALYHGEKNYVVGKYFTAELTDELSKFRVYTCESSPGQVKSLTYEYNGEQGIYTINGQKISGDTSLENLPHGIYIVVEYGKATKIIL